MLKQQLTLNTQYLMQNRLLQSTLKQDHYRPLFFIEFGVLSLYSQYILIKIINLKPTSISFQQGSIIIPNAPRESASGIFLL